MKSLNELNHTKVSLPSGGHVIVLDNGAAIDAEAAAMLQALHSRSTEGLEGHLQALAKRGAEKFMSSFYVGYGHKSIGDCGGTVLFIEGISMLAAKAIQDWPLYSGQESSTRYVDFAHLRFENPVNTQAGTDILEAWREFYVRSMSAVQENLKERFPKQDDEDEAVYTKAINARAFDALRGFLPAGATTNIAWFTNLRQAADKLLSLRHHPLEEVRGIAASIEEALQKAHPNSFGHKQYEQTEAYNEGWMRENYYYHDSSSPAFALSRNGVETNQLPLSVLKERPPKTELPRFVGEAGTVQFLFTLDFGSFRDIQRHRPVHQRMPLLTTELGFHPWYLSELPETVRKEAKSLIEEQTKAIEALGAEKPLLQYYVAMGFLTSNRLTGTLPELLYLVELRATRFVHPTLRERARQMAEVLREEFRDVGLAVHLDDEPDRFDVKRGEHDITLK